MIMNDILPSSSSSFGSIVEFFSFTQRTKMFHKVLLPFLFFFIFFFFSFDSSDATLNAIHNRRFRLIEAKWITSAFIQQTIDLSLCLLYFFCRFRRLRSFRENILYVRPSQYYIENCYVVNTHIRNGQKGTQNGTTKREQEEVYYEKRITKKNVAVGMNENGETSWRRLSVKRRVRRKRKRKTNVVLVLNSVSFCFCNSHTRASLRTGRFVQCQLFFKPATHKTHAQRLFFLNYFYLQWNIRNKREFK